MKVAICLFNYFPYGGLQHDCLKVVQECLKRNYPVDLYTMKWQGALPPKGCQVKAITISGVSNHQRCSKFSHYVATTLPSKGYQVVLGFNRMAGLDCYFASDVCFAEDSHRKHALWYRFTPRYRTYAALEREVFSVDSHCRILALTYKQIETYQHYYHTPKTRFHHLQPMIHPRFTRGEDFEAVRDQCRLEMKANGNTVLLMVGSDFHRKGLSRSLRALAALPEACRRQTVLWVVGDDQPGPWQREAVRLGVANQVCFLGARAELRPFYCAADLLLHPAQQEAAGLVLLEALACGLPVLTTDICGYATYVIQSRGGIVLPACPFDQQKMNEALVQCVTDRSLRKGYVSNTIAYCQKISLYSGQVDVVDQLEAIANLKQEQQNDA